MLTYSVFYFNFLMYFYFIFNLIRPTVGKIKCSILG